MQQHRSRLGAIAGAAWLLGVALACSDDPNCGAQNEDCALFEDALEDSLNDSDGPCASLSDAACERSGRCIMDAVCVAASCNGPGCSRTCEFVRACVPY